LFNHSGAWRLPWAYAFHRQDRFHEGEAGTQLSP
jgi:hypothetical protein